MSIGYILHLADYSDGVLYILALLLLVALAVMIDRFWSLRSTIMRGNSIIHATAAHAALSHADLTDLRRLPAACRKRRCWKPRSGICIRHPARRWRTGWMKRSC